MRKRLKYFRATHFIIFFHITIGNLISSNYLQFWNKLSKSIVFSHHDNHFRNYISNIHRLWLINKCNSSNVSQFNYSRDDLLLCRHSAKFSAHRGSILSFPIYLYHKHISHQVQITRKLESIPLKDIHLSTIHFSLQINNVNLIKCFRYFNYDRESTFQIYCVFPYCFIVRAKYHRNELSNVGV